MADLTLKTNGTPRIESVKPGAALPGGEVSVKGTGFGTRNHSRPQVQFGTAEGSLILAGDDFLVARVPEGAAGGAVRVRMGSIESAPYPMSLGVQVADNLHPVGNPAVDSSGNIYVTFSGQRGQKVPVSLYKITPGNVVKPFVTELVNPTGLAVDREGYLFVSCRNDGTVHRVSPDGRSMQWIDGMGIATGIAFDKAGSLYVGDRSGTIFKISPEREIFVFATLEPSIAAYHLAFSPAGELFVTGPTTSSYDRVYRISPAGEVSVFFRGMGRPQGLAFDRVGNLYVAGSFAGRRGIVRLTPQAEPELVLGGSNIVGIALLPSHRAVITTNNALYTLDWDIEGLPLNGQLLHAGRNHRCRLRITHAPPAGYQFTFSYGRTEPDRNSRHTQSSGRRYAGRDALLLSSRTRTRRHHYGDRRARPNRRRPHAANVSRPARAQAAHGRGNTAAHPRTIPPL